MLTAIVLRHIEQSCEYDCPPGEVATPAVMFLSRLCVAMLVNVNIGRRGMEKWRT